jgi:hypothetical protein
MDCSLRGKAYGIRERGDSIPPRTVGFRPGRPLSPPDGRDSGGRIDVVPELRVGVGLGQLAQQTQSVVPVAAHQVEAGCP